MSFLSHPAGLSQGCCVRGQREWMAGCSCPLMTGGPGTQFTPPAPFPQLWGLSYLLTFITQRDTRTSLICKGWKHYNLLPSQDGACVPSSISGLGKGGSGLLPGLLDELLEHPHKKPDSPEIVTLRGNTEALCIGGAPVPSPPQAPQPSEPLRIPDR